MQLYIIFKQVLYKSVIYYNSHIGGFHMVRLRILEILEEQDHTKYWLYKRMDMMSYRNFKNIIENETSSIRFEILDKLSRILNVPVSDLFEQTDDSVDE